ncbi:cuscuta receptor 1-like isoform X2 [Rhododendron vialii]|uniref:cuscuta receptor 1-like isoform X2 n=1 Tax=Rhododendron vialii TaxID=182163 RepID=UPI00265F700D|nr:cuscuta receptor 1-like isoform X2 [Rhododendron vialii]
MNYCQHLLMSSLWVLVIMLAVLENGCNGCLEKERIALLQLKDSINFPNRIDRLPSWEEDDNMDCCQWEHVECNSTTRRVIKLELGDTRERRRDDYWHLNVSILLPFESLRSLNLSWNRLLSFVGNEGIGILPNWSNLEELDLSYNYFDNSILPSLNKLSNLKSLRLAWNALNGSIYVEEFNGLNNLKELDLRGNAIFSISALNGIGILSNLTNLEELDLSWNNLGNGILPSLNKLSNLKFLCLAWNNLNGSIYVKGSQEELGILKKLEFLDLSDNDLDNSVWSFFGGLSSIKTLNLSLNKGLHGAVHNKDLKNLNNIENLIMDNVLLDDVLPYIRVMTSLQVLSLTSCDSKHISSIEGLCELKKLRELDVARSRFGGTLPWCLANLTSLRLLDITSNHFTGNIARSPLINLTSLEYLAISNNDFEVPISFKSFFNHSKLVFIESLNNTLLEEEDYLATSPSFQLVGLCLSNFEDGHMTRSFPRFLFHQHDLILVELSRTGFTGKFPYWLLDNNTRMETLILSYNSFVGPLLLPLRQMRNLFRLDISNNHLEGFLPYKIAGSFPSLEFFNMSTNNFEGNIPSSFGDMTALTVLDLSNNGLSGEIPVHLAKGCRLLNYLRLSNNFLKGPVLPHESNLTLLKFLYCDNNGFTEIPPNLSGSYLIFLDVSANELAGKIPAGFIGNNPTLTFLAMAGNRLEGPIPIELCRLEHLKLLDLSENNITGVVPSCFNSSYIYVIRLSKNRLDGPFPMAFQYSADLRLRELDLSYNQFSGTIPTWIGNLSYLEVLLLQHNNFEGNIPKELCNLSSLTLIDLSSNSLFGSIPPCISEIKFNGVNVGENGYEFSIDSAQTFTLLLHDLGMVLAKSEEDRDRNFDIGTTGQEAKFTTKGVSLIYRGIVLQLFSGINLSHNRLIGPIPPEIGNLSRIKVLNFSHNYLTGTIPATFSYLESIECLDLSYNHLNGKIPSQLTELYSLAVFNLSYNNLSGKMPPRVKQFGTFDSNSYVGNPLLCGEPLPKCNATDSPPSTPRAAVNDTKEDSGFLDMDVFYMSFAGSYVTVVLAIVAILLINPYWRRAWFHLVEIAITSCYYFVVDNLVKCRHCFHWK